mmetsp:Transcript_94362/g.167772  ORF Transcript_94362/g.167772 Transcript_94362/m.167772 type:complete len:179 (+) Transcript_94362:171-707(+)
MGVDGWIGLVAGAPVVWRVCVCCHVAGTCGTLSCTIGSARVQHGGTCLLWLGWLGTKQQGGWWSREEEEEASQTSAVCSALCRAPVCCEHLLLSAPPRFLSLLACAGPPCHTYTVTVLSLFCFAKLSRALVSGNTTRTHTNTPPQHQPPSCPLSPSPTHPSPTLVCVLLLLPPLGTCC